MAITEAHVKAAKKPLPAGDATYDVNDGKTGLVLRVGRRGATWAWRTEKATKTIRLSFGSVDFLSLTQARKLAVTAMEQVRDKNSQVDDAWVRDELVRMGLVEPPPPPEPKRETFEDIVARIEADAHWTFAHAREQYLDEVKRTKREDTWNDYRVILHAPELARFDTQKVRLITVEKLAEVIAKVHKTGTERRAEKIADTLRPMWTWLADGAVTLSSGIKPGIMKGLKAPKRSRDELGEEEEDDDHGDYVPPVAEFGRMLAILRAGVIHPVIAAAIELAILTAQRRRTIVKARRKDFVVEEGDLLVWKIPPAFRKTARKRGVKRRTHDLPLKGAARDAVERMLERPGDSPWLFRGLRPQKKGGTVSHLNVSALNHNVRIMPGVEASPHDFRRGYATHAQELLGIEFLETKLVLDHNEGIETDDVTESAYSRARRLTKKAGVLDLWVDLIEQAAEAAAPLLPHRAELRAAMTEARKPKSPNPAPEPEAKAA